MNRLKIAASLLILFLLGISAGCVPANTASDALSSSGTASLPATPAMAGTPALTFADLGENAWEVKYLDYNDSGYHVSDFEGVVRMDVKGFFELESFKNTDGIDLPERGAADYQERMNALIWGVLRGITLSDERAPGGIFVFHGHFFYYDGLTYDPYNAATDGTVMPLSFAVIADRNVGSAANYLSLSEWWYFASTSWTVFKGDSVTGLNTWEGETDAEGEVIP